MHTIYVSMRVLIPDNERKTFFCQTVTGWGRKLTTQKGNALLDSDVAWVAVFYLSHSSNSRGEKTKTKLR